MDRMLSGTGLKPSSNPDASDRSRQSDMRYIIALLTAIAIILMIHAPAWATSLLMMPVEVEGHKAKFLVDTGATYCLVTPALAESVGLKPNGKKLMAGAGGLFEAQTASIKTLKVGTIEFHNVPVIIHALPLSGEGEYGVLGLNAFTKFEIITQPDNVTIILGK